MAFYLMHQDPEIKESLGISVYKKSHASLYAAASAVFQSVLKIDSDKLAPWSEVYSVVYQEGVLDYDTWTFNLLSMTHVITIEVSRTEKRVSYRDGDNVVSFEQLTTIDPEQSSYSGPDAANYNRDSWFNFGGNQ